MPDGGVPENSERSSYQIRTFAKGENGKIDIGQYRDGLVKFFRHTFEGHQDEGDAESTVDEALRYDWEAIVLALDKNKVVGYGTVDQIDEEGNMEFGEAQVDPNYRRQGIYTQFVEARLNIAKQHGAKSVSLFAVGTNVAQQSLVDRHGFKKEGPDFYKKLL